ncbi:hypothetical protein V2H37_12465, partial [Avibacterium paragallinarum]|nr:hypothetical protein [Avibacterium paragallinarum]
IGTEIVSDFDDFIINEKLIRIDFPNSILSFKDEICVYRRYECQGNTKQNIKEVKNQNENIITVITR